MIYLARHGHVDNPDGVLYGNLPGFRLSALGRQQAAVLGRRLRRVPLAAVYSSPLERAVETASIATSRGPATLPALRDWEPDPAWVGVPWVLIPDRHPEMWRRFVDAPWIDGAAGAAAIRAVAASHPTANVLLVGHQDPLRAAINMLRPVPGARLRDDPLPQCGIRVLDPRTWRVLQRWDPPNAITWPAGAL